MKTKKTITKSKKKIVKSKKLVVKDKNLVSKDMTFAEVLNNHPKLGNVLFESGLHCIGCGGAMYESIEQGCMMHGFSKKQIEDLVKKMNKKNEKR